MGYPYPPRKVVGLLLLIALISLFAGCNEDAANVMLAGDSAGNSQPGDGEGEGDDDSTPPGTSPMLYEEDAPAVKASSEDAVTQ